jgi:hypothetical protein
MRYHLGIFLEEVDKIAKIFSGQWCPGLHWKVHFQNTRHYSITGNSLGQICLVTKNICPIFG